MPDIRTVAALAKVSIATVSRTINGSPLVSERLSKRVWQAIKQLNYFPNTHARTLVSGRSRLLGIIVENITNPFFPELIQSFEEIAVAHGYEILVSSSNSDPAVLTTCVRRMLERKVDGVAVMTFGEEETGARPARASQRAHRAGRVQARRSQGEHHSARLLHRHSRRRSVILSSSGISAIAFLAGPHRLHSAITRENDFRAAMQAAGLPVQKKWVIECDHTLKGGVAGFAQLQSLAARPTAIVCSNDMTAIGVLRAAYMDGLRVPRGSVRHRPRRHRFRRVHAAAAHHHSPLARRSGARGLRSAAPAGRRSRKPQNAARISGLHQPRGARIDGRLQPSYLAPKHDRSPDCSRLTREQSGLRS